MSLTEQELQGYTERSSQEMKRGKKDKDLGEHGDISLPRGG